MFINICETKIMSTVNFEKNMEKSEVLNYNMLLGNKFKFLIKRAKNFEYFCKKIQFPGISLNPTSQPTPFKNIPLYGDKIEYEQLSINFMIDEDMNNYFEIKNWLSDLGNNKSYQQFKSLKDKTGNYEDNAVFSEISLITLKNSNNPNKTITFSRCFPISLSGFDFDIEATTTEPRYAVARFAFTDYTTENV